MCNAQLQPLSQLQSPSQLQPIEPNNLGRFPKLFEAAKILMSSMNVYFLYDILGSPKEIINSTLDDESEYSIINSCWSVKLRYLMRLSIPTVLLPKPCYLPNSISEPFNGQDPQLIKSFKSNVENRQKWFYLNGMATCPEMVLKIQKKLETIFSVPIDIIYYPTNSLVFDLFESLTEKQWNDQYPITLLAHQTLVNALMNDNIDKVILICHSRGTIITANILTLMFSMSPKYLKKLEIYAFSNCSTKMLYIGYDNGVGYPYIESIGNIHDSVAKLGMFANHKSVMIDGGRFVNYQKHGHFMNMHYIDKFSTQIDYYNDQKQASRLYKYR